jgi:type I restriction enzyme M protein
MSPKSKRKRAAQLSLPEIIANLKVPNTEVEAYKFILDQLKEVGWNAKNPSRNADGHVWTQGQCHAHPEIKKALGGTKPENIVKLTETKLWVIEAKSDRGQLKKALTEAENDYAQPLMGGGYFDVPLISGVAGNDTTGYEVRTRLLVKGKYEPVVINGTEATGFLDPKMVERLLETGEPNIADFAVDESVFIKAAERINRTLHVGGINKNDRARVMAALLLAILENPGPNVESELLVLIDDINARTKAVLRKSGKPEFHPFVIIQPPSSAENHVKYRTAIIQTLQELKNLSIKSAMNSGTDVLGKFYEVFLKYGNGAKEIGIVLTPRHVTRFAVDVLGVSPIDVVLDPACGTGGFLVAAFDYVRATASAKQVDRFKQHNMFGMERESYIAILAIVNMIFRGDGKNNIIEANCFSKFLQRTTHKDHPSATYSKTKPTNGDEAVTRVFMNPPFALKESDEKEYRFVEAALDDMADGGLLFTVLPMSVMFERSTLDWRRSQLLGKHTLLAVVTFPLDLFYPTGVRTLGVIVRKGTPHPLSQGVLWTRAMHDGLIKRKGKRLAPRPEWGVEPDDLATLRPMIKAFLANPAFKVQATAEFVKVAPIDWKDPLLELLPEAYLDSRDVTEDEIQIRVDSMLREAAAQIIRFRTGPKQAAL